MLFSVGYLSKYCECALNQERDNKSVTLCWKYVRFSIVGEQSFLLVLWCTGCHQQNLAGLLPNAGCHGQVNTLSYTVREALVCI
jgi:hypothetical protein